jgi:transposase
MIREVLDSRVIHTDDTPVRTLDRQPGRSRIGRFWVYWGDEDHPQIVFAYTSSRSRDGPMNFLRNWGKQENAICRRTLLAAMTAFMPARR